MSSPGKHSKHARGIFCIARFAENFAVDDYHGVGAQNQSVRPATDRCPSFLSGETFRAIAPAFSGCGNSGMFVTCTVKAIPAWRKSSWRRGEAEARTRIGALLTFFTGKKEMMLHARETCEKSVCHSDSS